MEFSGVGNTDIFSTTIQQPQQLESLANGALSKGIDLYMRQDFEGAIKEFQAVIKRNPGYAFAYEGLGLAYYQLKDFDKSEKNFKKFIGPDCFHSAQ